MSKLCCRSHKIEPIFSGVIVCDRPDVPAKEYRSVTAGSGAPVGASTVKTVGQSEAIFKRWALSRAREVLGELNVVRSIRLRTG